MDSIRAINTGERVPMRAAWGPAWIAEPILPPAPAAVEAPPITAQNRTSPHNSDLYVDWIERPDYQGRMGIERPGLTVSQRWWARSSFDDLPDLLGAPFNTTKGVILRGNLHVSTNEQLKPWS